MTPAPNVCLQRARAAWGDAMPDWVEALAEECDRTSLRKTGAATGLSPATISLLVNNKYTPRPLAGVERVVRSKLSLGAVQCPVLGHICRQRCLSVQASPLNVHDPVRVQTYRACRKGCVHLKAGTSDGHKEQGKQ
jgi:hypothetical protein